MKIVIANQNKIMNIFKKLFKSSLKSSNVITVNGQKFSGTSLEIVGGKIWIDGKEVNASDKNIQIKVEGNIDNLQVDSCEKIEIAGNVDSLSLTSGSIKCNNVTCGIDTTSGDINCADIFGDIRTTSGNVECAGNVDGSIETLSGDVDCGNVSGKISTMSGNIKHK